MKKGNFSLITLLTCTFMACILGFYLGRNSFKDDIPVSIVSDPPSLSTYSIGFYSPSNKNEDMSININTAALEELMELPGIGETYAKRIIDYRNEHGNFVIVEDLLNVKGIGKKRLEAILDMITVGGLK